MVQYLKDFDKRFRIPLKQQSVFHQFIDLLNLSYEYEINNLVCSFAISFVTENIFHKCHIFFISRKNVSDIQNENLNLVVPSI